LTPNRTASDYVCTRTCTEIFHLAALPVPHCSSSTAAKRHFLFSCVVVQSSASPVRCAPHPFRAAGSRPRKIVCSETFLPHIHSNYPPHALVNFRPRGFIKLAAEAIQNGRFIRRESRNRGRNQPRSLTKRSGIELHRRILLRFQNDRPWHNLLLSISEQFMEATR